MVTTPRGRALLQAVSPNLADGRPAEAKEIRIENE